MKICASGLCVHIWLSYDSRNERALSPKATVAAATADCVDDLVNYNN